MSKQRVLPAPELIPRKDAPSAWRIADANQPDAVAGTAIAEGLMAVPLDDSDASAWTRRHEMGHLVWSPAALDVPREMLPYVLAVEDARVNLNLKAGRFDVQTHRDPGVTAATLMMRAVNGKPVDALLTRVAVAGTSDEAEAARTLLEIDPKLADIANEALRDLRKGLSRFETTKSVAEALHRKLHREGSTTKSQGDPTAARPSGGSADAPPMPAPTLVLPPMPKRAPEPPKPKAAKAATTPPPTAKRQAPKVPTVRVGIGDPSMQDAIPIKTPRMVSGDNRWGPMVTLTPPMPKRLDRRQGRGKWRPSDSGAHPRRMERWATDQAVFTTKGRQRSGTVLIDASSSMQLSEEAIAACVQSAPAATIAMYSGLPGSNGGGQLVLLARRGRRVAAIPQRGNGNVVDGPALRWLARQKAPRIWVCDGGVTGINDRQTQNLVTEAGHICRTFGILRVLRLDAAAAVLGGARVKRTVER